MNIGIYIPATLDVRYNLGITSFKEFNSSNNIIITFLVFHLYKKGNNLRYATIYIRKNILNSRTFNYFSYEHKRAFEDIFPVGITYYNHYNVYTAKLYKFLARNNKQNYIINIFSV